MEIKSEYFYGNKVSEYGLQNGYVDYRTLANSFDAVLNNSIMENTMDIGYWDQVSGMVDNQDAIDELQDELDGIDEFDENMDAATEKHIDELHEHIDELQNEMDEPAEVFQWFIVDDQGAKILQECNEIVYYNETLDMYLWGVTHYGTRWDYVLTNIKIVKD